MFFLRNNCRSRVRPSVLVCFTTSSIILSRRTWSLDRACGCLWLALCSAALWRAALRSLGVRLQSPKPQLRCYYLLTAQPWGYLPTLAPPCPLLCTHTCHLRKGFAPCHASSELCKQLGSILGSDPESRWLWPEGRASSMRRCGAPFFEIFHSCSLSC